MKKKLLINKNIERSPEGNYSLDINKDNKICVSSNNWCTIYDKNIFLSQGVINDKNKILLGDTIISSKFTPNSERLVISDYEYKISIYNINDFSRPYHQFNPGNLKSFKFAVSPDNNILCTGGNSVILFDINKKEQIKELDNHNKYLYSICFLTNEIFAAGNSNGSITIFNINEDKYNHKLETHCLPVRSLACNNNLLFSGSDDLHINITDINKYSDISPLVGHQDKISNLIFNAYSGLLFSSSFDGTIKIWDIRANPTNICSISEGKNNNIWDISVDEKGTFIVYTGEENIGAYEFNKS